MISEDVIQRVKELNNIVDVVSETVRLKRAGRYYTGLCPFHHEKTPSFTVTPDKQIYKCFGCGEAGNVISFVMKTKNLSFLDAVQMLADRVNIDIKYKDNFNPAIEKNEKLYKINVESARYFFSNLKKNKVAMNYLISRDITVKTINKFGLGYAVDSWDGLLKFLRSKGYSELDMLSAGLIIKSKKGSYYDRFRNRIIFPVFNYKGKVIGFGGRVLDNSKPKYLNSPETNVFKKGTNLYGLNFAIKNNTNRTFIIVEGYMDCISLHQHGISSTVASLGTALTANQAKLLKRYADKVIIAYDSDLAGEKATLRGLHILKEEGFDVRVLTIPEGKDPDEFIKIHSKEEFIQLMETSAGLIDYRIEKASKGINLKKPENVVKYAEVALDIIKDLKPVEKDIYIRKIADKTGIKNQALYDLMNNKLQRDANIGENMNIDNIFGNKLYVEPIYLKAERELLKLIIKNKSAQSYGLKVLNEDIFISKEAKQIFSLILENLEAEEDEIGTLIEIKFGDADTIREWVNIVQIKLIGENCDCKILIDDCIKEIKKYKLEETRKEIMNKIKKYESEGKINESLKLAQELMNIQRQLGGMQ
ncbi:DNA primase [Clostridium tetanomorphum]|uniref:DNA primase n=1 Tax=Clostridium tetanomorphum TaxID=1553 RepID=A0A923J1I0_CLOTT|nr:DNA primase [Clostridium tetanomorphum]KAJ49602.1 DNA primase [Clostridium tetanomorphum DSM 665]KAJ53873.1 DNA primase [Clostridium tetanomorphum DSM 665]MBC2397388.1 DNA primase [Clostridium tetanomorphum]MBP1862608.1 DNA primase [Clostridium tetanomorphum]NRS85551.1 DNA primase [Clostridium tetanomorphum]